MPDTDVLGYLSSKGLNLQKAGGWEYRTHCPVCHEQPQKGKRGRFYINVNPGADVPGLHHCFLCDTKGNLTTLKRFFGDPTSESDEESYEQFEIFKLAARFYERQLCGSKDLPPNEEILAYLRGPNRMLEDSTIRKFHLGYAPMEIVKPMDSEAREVPSRRLYTYLKEMGCEVKALLDSGLVVKRGDRVVDSLSGMVVIPYMVAGNVVDLRGRSWPEREGSPKYKTCSGRDSRLFNTDAIWNTEEVIATEGELDCLVMDQLGYRAVGFPGAKSFQDNWSGYFAPLKRVWLVFDRDVAGTAGMEKMREAIGPKARPIHLSEKGTKVDPTAWVAQGNGAKEFDELLSEARRGNLLVSVRDAIAEFGEVQGQPGLKFGWEMLDMMIDPGLLAGQLMIPLAKTGCLAGDTELVLGRQGVGFKMKLSDAYESWSGQRGHWDRSIPTNIQRAVDGVVRLGEVDEIWDSGVKPVYELRTTTGRAITGTAKHPFLTPDGWRKLGELEAGGGVCVNAGLDSAGWMGLEQVGVEEIESITFLGEQQTYDISMKDEPHNFMANGFVVHNTGKTLLLLNIMDMMRRVPGQEDLKFLFFSLEQTRGEWWDRARRIYRFHNPMAEDDDAERWWQDNLFIVDRNRLTQADLRLAVEDFAYQVGQLPDLILVDYLGYWARSYKGERYEAVSNAVMDMKGILKDLRCPGIVPHQVSRIGKDGEEFASDAARDSGVIEETADFGLNLWSPDNRLGLQEQEKTGKLLCRIGKSRHGGRGALIELQFAPLSLAMVPSGVGNELAARARREFFWRQAGENWESAVQRHRTGQHHGALEPSTRNGFDQRSFDD